MTRSGEFSSDLEMARAAGQAFTDDAAALAQLQKDFAEILELLDADMSVGPFGLNVAQIVRDELAAEVVPMIKQALETISENVDKLGAALVRQANDTQDNDEVSAKAVRDTEVKEA